MHWLSTLVPTDPALRALSYRQRAAALHSGSNLRLIAGAGSGKTRTLVHRVAYRINQGISPKEILAISFTREASHELSSRVLSVTGQVLPWARTFHSACLEIVSAHADKLGLPKNFSVAPEKITRKIARGLATEEINVPEIVSFVHRVKVTGKAALETADAERKRIFREFNHEVRSRNLLDYDDLVMKAVLLFKKHPDVLEYYRDFFKEIMVDEFQDVDPMQLEFIKLLANDNLTCVGDEDQAIYGWRYATLDGILRWDELFPGSASLTLARNYRCPRNVLDAALALIRNNKSRLDKNLYTRKKSTASIETIGFPDADREADAIAVRTARILDTDGNREVGILVRANTQMRLIGQALRDADIAYAVDGARDFFEMQEVQEVMAMLAIVVEKGAGPAEALDILAKIGPTPDHAANRRRAARVLGTVDAAQPPAKAAAAAMTALGYEETLAFRSRTQEDLETRHESIDEILGIMNREGGGCKEVLAYLRNAASPAKRKGAKVHLSTIHGAKGKEFDNVMIAGCERGLLPHAHGDIEEERRLMYVAMTRAKDTLAVFHTNYRRFPTTKSPFLAEARLAA